MPKQREKDSTERQEQTFYYAKIGKGNKDVLRYLGNGEKLGKAPAMNEIQAHCIPIYFSGLETTREDFLQNGSAKEQGRHFFDCADNPDAGYAMVIANGLVSIWQPVDNCEVIFADSEVDSTFRGKVKLMPVKVVAVKPIKDVPHIVASINSNRYYSSGTFRKINDEGNRLALRTLLPEQNQEPDWPSPSIELAINCLSSVQLETLVAKIFEEHGFFVPAYRGGAMKDIDLIARNTSKQELAVAGISVKPSSAISMQIKLRLSKKELERINRSSGVDVVIHGTHASSSGEVHQEWLAKALSGSPITCNWLIESLSWLPESFCQFLTRHLLRLNP